MAVRASDNRAQIDTRMDFFFIWLCTISSLIITSTKKAQLRQTKAEAAAVAFHFAAVKTNCESSPQNNAVLNSFFRAFACLI